MGVTTPPIVAHNIDRFTGRTWLLPIILQWLEGTSERLLLMTGGPGTGKSMIVAWLAGLGPSPSDPEDSGRLHRLRAYVKAAHFCMADTGMTDPEAMAKNVGEQLLKSVPGFDAALRATLSDRAVISVDQDVGVVAAGGSVTGINTLNLAGLGEERSFNTAVRRPLQKLYEKGWAGTILLLVDSLDEAVTYQGSVNIARLLAKLDDLPVQVRVLATTRRDPAVLKHFRGLAPVDLIEAAPSGADDVYDYVCGRLRDLADGPRQLLAANIARAADRNFLYAALILDDLLPRLSEIPDLATYPLPEKLPDLYHTFLLRVLDSDDPLWYNLYGPVLGLIAVAQGDGLRTAHLKWLMRQSVDLPVRKCRQFLRGEQEDGPFRAFHQSFADFLLDDEENLDYHLDGGEQHGRIADGYWQALSQDRARLLATDPDGYGVRYLPVHQSRAGQVDRLRQLVFDFDWLEAKIKTTGVTAALADLDLLRPDDGLELLRGALQLSAHVLMRDHAQLGAQLLARLPASIDPDIDSLLVGVDKHDRLPRLHPLSATLTVPGGALQEILSGHEQTVTALAMTPDEKQLVSAASDRTLILWDLESGTIRHIFEGHEGWVSAVAVIDNGQRVLSASWDTTIKVWNLDTYALERTLRGHKGRVMAITVLPDGRILTGSSDRTIKLWAPDVEEPEQSFEIHKDVVNALAVVPNTSKVVSASQDGTLKVWNWATAEVEYTLTGHKQGVEAVAVTSDGSHAVSASADNTLKVWDLATGKEEMTLTGHSDAVRCMALSRDGTWAVSGSSDNTVKVWNLQNGVAERTLTGHVGPVRGVLLGHKDTYLLSGSADRTVRGWDLAQKADAAVAPRHAKLVSAIAITPDGKRAISASADTTLKVWDVATGRELHTLRGHSQLVRAVAARGNEQAVSVGWDNALITWELDQGVELARMPLGGTPVNALALLPDGARVIVAGEDALLHRWNLLTGAHEHVYRTVHTAGIKALALTADGRRAITGSSGASVRLWNLETETEEGDMHDHRDTVVGTVIVRNDTVVLSASRDGTVRIWELLTGTRTRLADPRSKQVYGVAATPDGKWAVTVSEDGSLRLWNVDSRQMAAAFTGDSRMTACAITADGRHIVAGDGTGNVHTLKVEL